MQSPAPHHGGQQDDGVDHGTQIMSRSWDDQQVTLPALPHVLPLRSTTSAVQHLHRRLTRIARARPTPSRPSSPPTLPQDVLVTAEHRGRAPPRTRLVGPLQVPRPRATNDTFPHLDLSFPPANGRSVLYVQIGLPKVGPEHLVLDVVWSDTPFQQSGRGWPA